LRKLLLATALILPCMAAHANVVLSGNDAFSDTYDANHGGPTVTGLIAPPFSVPMGATNFFTLSPAGSCSGGGCAGNTETDPFSLSLTGLSLNVNGTPYALAPMTFNGTFTAQYSGTILPCAAGDGVSPNPGATDCAIWSNGGNNGLYNGTSVFTDAVGNGQTLQVTLYNATDWNVKPKVSLALVGTDAPNAPEPASLALLATGLLGFGFVTRRRS
jgi:hypothetical protein